MTPSLKPSDKVDMSGLVFVSSLTGVPGKELLNNWSKGEIRMKESTSV